MNKNKSSTSSRDLAWPELIPGTLVKRYKRFMADIKLADGEVVTAHCANTGAMVGLKDEGMTVHLSPNTNPKAKLGWRWEAVELDGMALMNLARHLLPDSSAPGAPAAGPPPRPSLARPDRRGRAPCHSVLSPGRASEPTLLCSARR